MRDEAHTSMTRRALLKALGIAAAGLAALGRFCGAAWGKGRAAQEERPTPRHEQRPVWIRFTERARRIMVLAQEEAAHYGVNCVAPEHLLLALVRERDCRGALVLEHLGIDLDRVRARVELRAGREPGAAGEHKMLTPGAKRVINHALEESRLNGDNYIGSEHLLLGLLQDEGTAGQVLDRLGASPERARRALTAT
jgi:ATP-dependent Clp protease ATP-binding subunit ClpA